MGRSFDPFPPAPRWRAAAQQETHHARVFSNAIAVAYASLLAAGSWAAGFGIGWGGVERPAPNSVVGRPAPNSGIGWGGVGRPAPNGGPQAPAAGGGGGGGRPT